MATVLTLPAASRRQFHPLRAQVGDTVHTAACAVGAVLLLGYHPSAEDGGIYAAAAKLRLGPSLFPADRAFAAAHVGSGMYLPVVCSLTQALRLPLSAVLFVLHCVCVAAMLWAAAFLCRSLFTSTTARRWAVTLLAAGAGLPVAGTALYLADPYLTARSFSTPLLLLSTAFVLRRNTAAAMCCLAAATAFHPLMALWGAVLLLMLWARQSVRPVWRLLVVCCAAAAVAGAVAAFAPADTAAVRAASLSRGYWFLSRWRWYETLGMVAPAVLLLVFARRTRPGGAVRGEAVHLAYAAAAAIALVCGISLVLIHPGDSSFLLTRAQPLRLLHPAYLVFVLLMGGMMSSLRHRRWAWVPLCVVVAAGLGLFLMQRELFPASSHLEWPGRTPRNGYVQAFVWAREHTPENALFALDADYTTAEGEEANVFRAIAERSSLPDAAKDGGVSSVVAGLAEEWWRASQAQGGLSGLSDEDRLQRIRPLRATWMLLPAAARTGFTCPYANVTAKVCRLP